MKSICEIKFYASLSEKTGKMNDWIEADWNAGDDIHEYIKNKYPEIKHLPFSVAINRELVDTFPHSEVKEMVIMPPFAGG